MLHIYTLPRGGSGRLVPRTRTENQDAGACCPPPATPLPGKPCISHLHWARRSCSWSRCANQACGEVVEALLLSHSQRGGHVLRGWPPSCCRAQRGLVGRLPVHPEAIDTGVLGVAPVSQDPQLHHLVRGHCRVLGREGGHQACQSPQTRQQTGGAVPSLGPDVPLSWASAEYQAPKLRYSDPGGEFPAGGPRSPRGFRGPTGATHPGPHKNGFVADSSHTDAFTVLIITVSGQNYFHERFAVGCWKRIFSLN